MTLEKIVFKSIMIKHKSIWNCAARKTEQNQDYQNHLRVGKYKKSLAHVAQLEMQHATLFMKYMTHEPSCPGHEWLITIPN